MSSHAQFFVDHLLDPFPLATTAKPLTAKTKREGRSPARPGSQMPSPRKALRDSEAGKNLTESSDADDLFRRLGVKGGKSEATAAEPPPLLILLTTKQFDEDVKRRGRLGP